MTGAISFSVSAFAVLALICVALSLVRVWYLLSKFARSAFLKEDTKTGRFETKNSETPIHESTSSEAKAFHTTTSVWWRVRWTKASPKDRALMGICVLNVTSAVTGRSHSPYWRHDFLLTSYCLTGEIVSFAFLFGFCGFAAVAISNVRLDPIIQLCLKLRQPATR